MPASGSRVATREPRPVVDIVRPPLHDDPQSFTLDNGMRVVVVERHGVPLVATRLVVTYPSAATDPQAELRMRLVEGSLLYPPDSEVNTNVSCDADECAVVLRGASADLDELVRREADFVRRERADLPQRFDAALRFFFTDNGNPGLIQRRATAATLFGYDSAYGPSSVPPKPLTLAELRAWRAKSFVPSATTLVLVGDVTVDAVRGATRQHFASWTGPSAERDTAAWPALPDPPRVTLVSHESFTTDLARISVRGPAWSSADLPPFLVAARLLDAPLPEVTPCGDRRANLSTTRASTPITVYRQGSVVSVGGSFDADSAIEVLSAVHDTLRAVRTHVTDESLASARSEALVEWRHRQSELAGEAELVDFAMVRGKTEGDVGLEKRIAAVTAADVQRVLQKYFAEDALRVVLVGAGPHFRRLQSLGLDGFRVLNVFGRETSKPGIN